MKKRFRIVTFLILGSLFALVALQGWWLWRMYYQMDEQFERKVQSAMDRAAYEELLAGSRNPSLGHLNTSVITSGKIDSIKVESIKSISVSRLGGGNTPGAKMIVMHANRGIPDTIKRSESQKPGMIYRSMYYDNRGAIPLNFDLERYDSVLSSHLVASGISLPHRVEIVGDQEKATNFKIKLDDSTTVDCKIDLNLQLNNSSADQIRNPRTFTTPLDDENKMMFRVTIENPNMRFLRDMAGIILSSLLIVALIGFSFIYLLRTLFRQKSLEQMRIDFTHNITHELKTPIAVATAATDALENFGADNDPLKRRKYLGIISSQLAALTAMVERILDTALQENGEFATQQEDLSVKDLLDKLAADYRIKAGDATITVSVEDEALTVYADLFHISGLLGNLMDNALKYSPGGADISLTASRTTNSIEIKVSDKGIGIPKAAQRLIFEKFYRVPTGNLHTTKGTGLGLYYAQIIARKHGGTLTVSSSPGAGSTFTLNIPCRGR